MKTKTETRTVMVPETIGGTTHMVPVQQEVSVPVVPTDWDAVALGAVRTAASLAVAGAVTWSTVAIGDLLAGVAPVWAAYLVAGVFDLAWIICMVLEWLCRFDRKRATLPIVCGWLALGVSVSLITLHGASNGATILGACGGAVSVIAKGVWTVVMRHTAVAMDSKSQAWLDAERRDVQARLAVTAARRQLTRTEALTAAETLALSAGQQDTWTVVPVRDTDRETVPVSLPVQDSGQDTETVRETVPVLVSAPRTVRPGTASDMSGKLSQRAFVRGLLTESPELSNAQLSDRVREEYGQDTPADSIRKAIQRARGDVSQAV